MNLVDALKKFNRKERYWVVREALGQVELCKDFRDALKQSLKKDIPENAYWAMDYHFDWLAGVAAMLAQDSEDMTSPPRRIENFVTGALQDIDLLVAFENTLILIECKAGGAWQEKQLKEKYHRYEFLKELFKREIRTENIKIEFAVLSPKKYETKINNGVPDMRWLELKNYNEQKFCCVERFRLNVPDDAPYTHYRVRNS